MEFEAPPHLAAINVPQDFSAVVVKKADAEGMTYSEALVKLAIAGAECSRICKGEGNGK